MNRLELVSNVADATSMSKVDAERAVNCVFEEIRNCLINHDSLTILGFGTFTTYDRAARTGRNPSTGETFQIEASKGIKFKPSKKLKDEVK